MFVFCIGYATKFSFVFLSTGFGIRFRTRSSLWIDFEKVNSFAASFNSISYNSFYTNTCVPVPVPVPCYAFTTCPPHYSCSSDARFAHDNWDNVLSSPYRAHTGRWAACSDPPWCTCRQEERQLISIKIVWRDWSFFSLDSLAILQREVLAAALAIVAIVVARGAIASALPIVLQDALKVSWTVAVEHGGTLHHGTTAWDDALCIVVAPVNAMAFGVVDKGQHFRLGSFVFEGLDLSTRQLMGLIPLIWLPLFNWVLIETVHYIKHIYVSM